MIPPGRRPILALQEIHRGFPRNYCQQWWHGYYDGVEVYVCFVGGINYVIDIFPQEELEREWQFKQAVKQEFISNYL